MAPNSLPPEQPSDRLVVAITARALFDLEDSHALFQASGLEAYAQFQRSREKEVLPPGIAFPLVQKLLALNVGAPPESPRVEVVLLSRNSSDTGLRIFNSIRHYGLGIVRAVFTSGAEVWPYIRPFGAQLFLSANPASVRSALEHGFAAATILPAKAYEPAHPQLRIAFDGDAVIFGDEGERLSQEGGLDAFHKHERERAREDLPGQQRGAIGMRRQAAQGVEVGAHRDVLTEQAHALGAVHQAAAEGAGGGAWGKAHASLFRNGPDVGRAKPHPR